MRSSLAFGALVLAVAAGCASGERDDEYGDVKGPKGPPPQQEPKRRPEPRPAPPPPVQPHEAPPPHGAPYGSAAPYGEAAPDRGEAPPPPSAPPPSAPYGGNASAPAREAAPTPAPKAQPAPRVLVLAFARADQPELAAVVQGAAEEVLLDLRFPLVDESQVMARYQLADLERFLILTPEIARMAELRARFGVELIAVVQYTRRFQYERDIVGNRSRFYKNDVRVKVIVPDTAEVVHSGGAEGTIEARQTGLEELTRDEVKKAAAKILERRSYEAVSASTYQVVAIGLGASGARALAQALRGQPGVDQIVERGVAAQGGEALLEVKFTGSLDELKEALAAVNDPAVEVEGASSNRIEVRKRNP